ncbi:MAG: hypothetical protein ACOYD1_07850 [Candidatus Nanopelagicales bacterium]
MPVEDVEATAVDDLAASIQSVIEAVLADGPGGAPLIIVLNHDGKVTMQSQFTPAETVRWIYEFGMAILDTYEASGWPPQDDENRPT